MFSLTKKHFFFENGPPDVFLSVQLGREGRDSITGTHSVVSYNRVYDSPRLFVTAGWGSEEKKLEE